jgi:hypothetical protein
MSGEEVQIMENEPQNAVATTAALTPSLSSGPPVLDAQIVRPDPIRTVRTSERIKKIAWRITAAGYWSWWLIRFLLGSEFLSRLSSGLMTKLVGFLSSVGFAPSHSEHLPKILRYGWLLTIVGFKSFELMGLAIYIYTAPLILLLYLFFRGYGKDLRAAQTVKKGLRPPRVRRPALTTFSLLLLGWFVLYGEANSRNALIVGAVLSGCLFLSLASRTFQRVRPPIHPNPEKQSLGEAIGLPLFTGAQEAIEKAKKAKTKSDVIGSLFMYRKASSIWRNLALLIRGEQGRNRLYLVLLTDYVVSFLVLGAAAVLFWAIVAKTVSVPTTSALTTFIHLSSSYLMPNIKSPVALESLPLWVEMGSSVTSFVLFVLFVGAAASLLPSRYAAYADRVSKRYQANRKYALCFKVTARALEKIKLSKPTRA